MNATPAPDISFSHAVQCLISIGGQHRDDAPLSHSILKVRALRVIIYYIGCVYFAAQQRFISALITRSPIQITQTLVDGTVVHLLDRTHQFNYQNLEIGCKKSDGSGACASFTLAALKQASSYISINNILQEGFKIHRSYGLRNEDGRVDVTAYALPKM